MQYERMSNPGARHTYSGTCRPYRFSNPEPHNVALAITHQGANRVSNPLPD